jgi:hypothetical protein
MALVVVIGVVVVATRGGDDKIQLRGLFILFDKDVDGSPDDCHGTGGYSDFGPGQPVTVRNSTGQIIGAGTTRATTSKAEFTSRLSAVEKGTSIEAAATVYDRAEGIVCPLLFEVKVPRVDFYEIEIGRRGKITETLEDLQKNQFVVEFSLGA